MDYRLRLLRSSLFCMVSGVQECFKSVKDCDIIINDVTGKTGNTNLI